MIVPNRARDHYNLDLTLNVVPLLLFQLEYMVRHIYHEEFSSLDLEGFSGFPVAAGLS